RADPVEVGADLFVVRFRQLRRHRGCRVELEPHSVILRAMPDPAPIRADEIVVGCVTEDNPKYLGQTMRLLQSIRWFGGELARSRVVVGAVEQIDPRARRAFEALDAEIRVVQRFDARNAPGNRLQMFDELYAGPEQNFFMLDCDTIIVRDPLSLLRRGVFQA